MEGSEYDNTIKRSIVRSDCPPKEETSDIDRQIYIHGLCPGREIISRRKGKCWRYRSVDLDLGSVQENHDKVMEREMNCSSVGMIWCKIMAFLLGVQSEGCMSGGG